MEFEQIYSVYFKFVYRYIWKLSGDEHIAEEITSETFLKAMKSIGDFRGECDMRVWICQIAKNSYYSYLKKNRRTESIDETELQSIADPRALPLYLENMVSEGTKVFVEEHLESCPDCTAELEQLKSGKQIDMLETPQREHDTEVITVVKKKIAKRIFKAVAVVCLVFAVLFGALLFYTGIGYPVTRDSISLSTKTEGEYSYIVLETKAGKSLYFNSKTEDILNDQKILELENDTLQISNQE